jgi:DNA-binding CsgD family transcriptional regulator
MTPGAFVNRQRVPDDFPRASLQGAVSGAQPKLLLRKIGGMYRAGLTDDEVYERYVLCKDFAQQLAAYTSRIMAANAWSLQTALSKVEVAVVRKVRSGLWDFSNAEIAWTIECTRQMVSNTMVSDKSLEPDTNIPTRGQEDTRDK